MGNTDERAYRVTERTALKLDKRGSVMRLHADKYSADVQLFIEGFGKWTEWVASEGSGDRQQLAAMLDGLRAASADGNRHFPDRHQSNTALAHYRSLGSDNPSSALKSHHQPH